MTEFLASLQLLFDSSFFALVIIPILIFLARVADVTLGTFRIIFTSRGQKYLAPLFGFIEVFIWVAAMGQIMKNVNNLIAYFAYAAGFATGNYVGMFLEERLALGTLLIRVITPDTGDELSNDLHAAGYGTTKVLAEGSSGSVSMIYTIVRRKAVEQVVQIIHKTHPKAFISVDEVRSTMEGIFPPQAKRPIGTFIRKGK
ncbi:MAG: DUF2179 domain-containing protein [Chloroflexota bacterium]